MIKNISTESTVREIRRKTRKQYPQQKKFVSSWMAFEVKTALSNYVAAKGFMPTSTTIKGNRN